MKKLMLTLGIAGLVIGCSVSNNSSSQQAQLTPQDDICTVSAVSELGKCKVGQLMYFEPNRWGNEQLPTLVIALACDTNKPVFYNNAGVVCTYVVREKINGKPINGGESAGVAESK